MAATLKVAFTITSSERGSSFGCKLDEHAWEPCQTSRSYVVKPGNHTFQARATDRAGNVDRTPASWKWTVRRK